MVEIFYEELFRDFINFAINHWQKKIAKKFNLLIAGSKLNSYNIYDINRRLIDKISRDMYVTII